MGSNSRKKETHSSLSIVLVVGQFLFLVLIMLAGPIWPSHWVLKGMMTVSGIFALWSFAAMGLRNLRPFPEIPQHGRLVMHGPYRWVRHPMYANLILLTLAWTLDHPLPFRLVMWIGLLVILGVKLNYEEKFLLARFPEYEDYQKRTKHLIPFLY